jgi:TraY domain
MKQYKVSLPDELHQRLVAASDKSGRSLSDEIRTRVEESLNRDALDKVSRDWADLVQAIATEIHKETGQHWHKHAGAWEAFQAAMKPALEVIERPPGTTKFGARPHQSIPEDDPHYIGRWAAIKVMENDDWTKSPERLAMEQSFKQMKELKEKSYVRKADLPGAPGVKNYWRKT